MEFLKKKESLHHHKAEITISTGETVLNFCSNNYLGLSSHPEVVQAAKDTLDTWIRNVICPFYLWNTRYSQN
jgi:glycine C-acetyltransferase